MILSDFEYLKAVRCRCMILEDGDFSLFGGVKGGHSSIVEDEVVVVPGVSEMQDYFGGRLEAECDSEARPVESHTLV